MKNKSKKSEIKSAPLYAILGSAKKAGVNIRIMPLSLAKKKDGSWLYPSTGGTKQVPVKSLGLVDISDFTNPSAVRKYYRGYCLKSGINKLVSAIKSIAEQSANKTVQKTVAKPAVKKTPVKPVVSSHAKVTSKKTSPAVEAELNDSDIPERFSEKDKQDIIAVKAILAGDKSKFTVLYKRYYAYINYMFASSLKYDNDLADDLTADLFTKVFENLGSYKPKFTFNSWITRVAKNLLIDYTRKDKKSPAMVSVDAGASSDKMHNDGDENISMELPDTDSLNPEQELIRNQKHEMLQKALGKIDARTRQLLVDFYNGKTYEELSKETGIEFNTVKSILFRGKAMLKDIIKSDASMYATV